jgi:outer membrane protein assembly factor BamB
LAVINGAVYAGAPYALVAFDADTGAERWRFHMGEPRSGQVDVGSPVVSDGMVYVLSANMLFAVNAS